MSDYQKPCGYPVMDCALGVSVTKCENRIEELEAKLAKREKQRLALAGDKIDLVSELAGVKGKLAKAREEGFWAGRSCGGAKKEIDAALAELKGQDDEL